MRKASSLARAAALVLTALLSSTAATAVPPASAATRAATTTAAATQRRTPARQRPRPAPPAPTPRQASPAQTTTRPVAPAAPAALDESAPGAQSARPAPQTTQPASGPAQPASRTGQPAAPAAADAAARERSAGADRSFEEMVGADAYGIYVEVRKLATLFGAAEVKATLGAAALIEPDAAELLHLANFLNDNSEVLADARAVVALLPTRAELPGAMVAAELPSPEAARLFEPKFRAYAAGRERALSAPAAAPARGTRGRAGRQGRARASRPAANRTVVRRVGSWLISSDEPFTLRRLAGSAGSLADNARFQNLRSRFANDSIFIYFDTDAARRGWLVEMQRQAERAEAAGASGQADAEAGREPSDASAAGEEDEQAAEVEPRRGEEALVIAPNPAPPLGVVVGTERETKGAPASDAERAAAGEEAAGRDGQDEAQGREAPMIDGEPMQSAPPTEAQVAGRHLSAMLGGLFGGIPRLPGAVAAGLSVEGGSFALRVAVENSPAGPSGLIPFLPNIVAGPPIAVETSAAAPASNGILFVTTLDWVRIFDSIVGTADNAATEAEDAPGSADEVGPPAAGPPPSARGAEGDKPPTAEARLALIEKVLGFSLRRDLLPSLGHEVAVSMPFDIFTRRAGAGRLRAEEGAGGKEGEEDAEDAPEPGFVAIVTLNDPDRVRPLVPKLALLLGFAGAAQAAEKRAGYEINTLGSFAYSILGRFLVVSDEPSHVRHAVDAYARGETLAQTDAYRDSTAWQPAQRLAHAYVSPEMMASLIRESKRMAEGSEDPLVISTLPQLDLEPEPITFAAAGDGDVLIHELRLPFSLGRAYAATAVIASREGSNISAETMASAALDSIYYAQLSYKARQDRGRYGTLEELIAEGLVEKSFVRRDDYRIELTAIGDRFEVTATPVNYGKTGRRSFYVDQSGVVRGANHKGRPATAADPPVN